MNVTCYGERHGQCKIPSEGVRLILASSEGTMVLAKRYDVNKRTIQRIRNGEERWHEP